VLSAVTSFLSVGCHTAVTWLREGTLALEQAPSLTIDERWDAGVAIAIVRGEIDIDTVGTLSEYLRHLAGKYGLMRAARARRSG
jgi:hypothetical protein